MSVDSELDAQALEMAQRLIEEQRILAGDDFRRVNSTSTTEGIFSGRVDVSRHDFFVKSISAAVNWNIDGRNRQTEISALITDYGNTAGNDTCDSNLTGDWSNPQIKHFDFAILSEIASSTISDIDAYKGKLYVVMEESATTTDPTMFIFNIIDPVNPKKFDNSNIKNRLAAITLNQNYAFTANITSVNQLQIMDVKNPDNPVVASKLELKNKITGEDCKGTGKNIFYREGYVYLGTSNDNNCPEFNVIDIKNINNPIVLGNFEIGAGINDIYIKGDYAYLATADSARELIILDIADPSAPVLFAVYNLLPDQTNWGYGKSIKVIGNKIYFGRTYIANSPEFYLFNHNQSLISVLDNYSDNGAPFSVNDLIIRNNLAFILAGSASQGGSLRILNIADPANIVEEKIISLPGVADGVGGVAMDCEGNYLYVASIDGEGKSYVSIITAP